MCEVKKLPKQRKVEKMNTIVNSNYQTAFGMKQSLKSAEIIQRRAKNTYQHFSPIVVDRYYNSLDIPNKLRLSGLRLSDLRYKWESGQNYIKELIDNLKSGEKLGNGREETMLATAIGRMNWQNNIYAGYFDGLDHAVSFITNKAVKDGKEVLLKGKDAIIIDPQLGITDYAGNYCSKVFKNNSGLQIKPMWNDKLDTAPINDLRAGYPELIIRNYKKVEI